MVQSVSSSNPSVNNISSNSVAPTSGAKKFIEDIKDGDKKSMAILAATGVALLGAIGGGIFAMINSKPQVLVDRAIKNGGQYFDIATTKIKELQKMFTEQNNFSYVVNNSQKVGLPNGKYVFGNNSEYMRYIQGDSVTKGLFEVFTADGSKVAEFEEDSRILKLVGIKGNVDAYATMTTNLDEVSDNVRLKELVESLIVKEDGIGTNVRFQYDFNKEGRLFKFLKASVGDERAGENVTAQLEILFDKKGQPRYVIKGVENINDVDILQGKKVYVKKAGEWRIEEHKSVNLSSIEEPAVQGAPSVVANQSEIPSQQK